MRGGLPQQGDAGRGRAEIGDITPHSALNVFGAQGVKAGGAQRLFLALDAPCLGQPSSAHWGEPLPVQI
jgi:hypothetical protein